MPGKVLGGRYQVQDKIGTGGMATVFRGQDEVLGRTVAIKTMLPQYATDPSFAARFKQEAQAAAALQSPYIVAVYDWGKDSDTYYIVMEYLRGTDLKSGIRKHGALDCKKVAQIGSQIAQALSVAHKHDIIHRDIKPQNIMVQPDGNIKVMDFGIARAKNSHLTQDNSVLGTAHYVSPEQTQGKALGPTTDIYSLGIVMYEAATGQVPFQGDDAISVALKQVNEQPKPPSQLNPAVDPSLEAIILKCMQKDPAARFQTADELYRTLRDYLSGRRASVNAATSVIPAQVTNKLERGAGAIPAAAAAQGTASMPRIERTGRFRPQTATEQAAEQEEERSRKKRRNVILGVIAGLAVAAAVIFAAVSVLGSGTQMATVPNLLKCTQEDAIKSIKDAGFEVGTVDERYDETVDEGLVCDQSPSANSERAKGTKIDIYLSKGAKPAEEVSVPDLSGKTEAEARKALTSKNLVPANGGKKASDDIEEGLVCDQDVTGTAKAGDTVTYYISTGPDQVVIPAVIGDSKDAAVSRLQDSKYGFKVTVVEDYSSDYAKGKVIAIDPGEGSTVDVGASVTITVSKGVEEASVPSVVGMSYSAAVEALKGAGFKVQLASGSSEGGTVTNQSVTGTAEVGTTVTLTTKAASTGGDNSGSGTNTGDNTGDNSGSGTGTGDVQGNGYPVTGH